MGDGRPTALLKAAAGSACGQVCGRIRRYGRRSGRRSARRYRAVAQYPAHPAGAAGRAIPPRGRSGRRPGRPRPSRRDDRRFDHRRARADAALAELTPHLALGLQRVAISRELGPSDVGALRFVSGWIKNAAPDVLHGHGAKGAALARLTPSAPNAIRVYTPHGGSLVYRPGTLGGGFYRTLEWLLKWRTDLFLFESSYIAGLFRTEIGRPPGIVRVVHNGVGDAEFAPIVPRARRDRHYLPRRIAAGQSLRRADRGAGDPQIDRPAGERHDRRRRAGRGGTQGAGGTVWRRRPGPLRRLPTGARGLRHGAHDGDPVARANPCPT